MPVDSRLGVRHRNNFRANRAGRRCRVQFRRRRSTLDARGAMTAALRRSVMAEAVRGFEALV
jgi:hypothetical protein